MNQDLMNIYNNYEEGIHLFSGILNQYANIPQQNFSVDEKAQVETLQNGILALENLKVKLVNYSETGVEEDTDLENKAVSKAMGLVDSISTPPPDVAETIAKATNGMDTKKVDDEEDAVSVVKTPGNDKSSMNTFTPLTNIDNNDINSFKPQTKGSSALNKPKPLIADNKGDDINSYKLTGDPNQGQEINAYRPMVTGNESINGFKPLVNGSDNFSSAFFANVENTINNFSGSFYIGGKGYSSDIGKWIKKGESALDKKPIDQYTADLVSTSVTGGIAGAAVDLALSALTRRLSYDDYAENCRNKGIEPLSKDAYTIGTVNNLKTSLLRGGLIGAGINLVAKGGRTGALGFRIGVSPASVPMANFSNDKGEVVFSLTGHDLDDLLQYASIKAENEMRFKYNNSLSTLNFSDFLKARENEYLSALNGFFNNAMNRVINYSYNEEHFANAGDAARGAAIGGLIAGGGAGLMAALNKNKLYDAYAAGERAQGRDPMSRAKWVLLSDEVKKSAGMGLLAGGLGGAAINISRKRGNYPTITTNNNNDNNDNNKKNWSSGNRKVSKAYQDYKTYEKLVSELQTAVDSGDENKINMIKTQLNKVKSKAGSKSIADNLDIDTKLSGANLLKNLKKRKEKLSYANSTEHQERSNRALNADYNDPEHLQDIINTLKKDRNYKKNSEKETMVKQLTARKKLIGLINSQGKNLRNQNDLNNFVKKINDMDPDLATYIQKMPELRSLTSQQVADNINLQGGKAFERDGTYYVLKEDGTERPIAAQGINTKAFKSNLLSHIGSKKYNKGISDKLKSLLFSSFERQYGYMPNISNPQFKHFCFSLCREGKLNGQQLYELFN